MHNLKREGAQVVVANLARALDHARWPVLVHGWHSLGPLAETIAETIATDRASATTMTDATGARTSRLGGVRVSGPQPGAPSPGALSGLLALRRIVRDERIGLIHAHMSDAAILAYAATRGTGVPFIVTHHSNRLVPADGSLREAVRRAVLRRTVRAAATNVAVSDAVRERLSDELGLHPTRTTHVGNGVEVPSGEAVARACAERRARGVANDARLGARLVMVGRLAPVKHHATLIEAMPRILAARPDARVEIVGDGPLRDALARHVARVGVTAAVDFPGSVDDVGARLARSDLLVATSSYEGLPMAVLEAMSWCLPVVASDVPGHRDTIESGRTGLLVPFDDPEALASAVLRLLDRSGEAAALGVAGRETVVSTYSSRVMAGLYEDLYARYAPAEAGAPPRPRFA